MNQQNYTASIVVDATPQVVFNSINNIASWWTINVKGNAENLDDIFTVSFGETFMTIKIIESIPYQKIGWHVIDCCKHWLEDKEEWKDTTMKWEISTTNNTTQIHFTHIGLVPGIECYDVCEKAWDFYIQESLFKLLTEGKGKPDLK